MANLSIYQKNTVSGYVPQSNNTQTQLQYAAESPYQRRTDYEWRQRSFKTRRGTQANLGMHQYMGGRWRIPGLGEIPQDTYAQKFYSQRGVYNQTPQSGTFYEPPPTPEERKKQVVAL